MRKWTEILAILLALSTRLALAALMGNPDLAFVKSVSQNENAKPVIDKLARTARVISAVTLLNGLSDGSIPVDNVISELMNLGSTDLKSLENFDKSKVHAFMDKLKTVNLKDDLNRIESALRDLYTVQQKWKVVGNLNGLPDENTYKELYALKKIDVSSLKNLPFDTVLDLLAKPSLSEADVGSLKTFLTDISTKISSTKTSINLEEMDKILESLKPLYIISEVFTLFDSVTHVGVKYVGNAHVQSAVANFKLLNGITSTADSSVFETIEQVISSRFSFHPTNREFSAGLVNGFADLNKLDDDSKDDWIQKLFGSSVKLDGLNTLAQLQKPMMDIDGKWRKHATLDVFISITRVISMRKLMLESGGEAKQEELEAELNNLEKCTNFPRSPKITDKLNKVAKGSAELSRKVPALLAVRKAVGQLKTEVIDKISTAATSEDIQKARSIVLKLQSDLKVVQYGKSFKDIDIQYSITDFITEFLTYAATKDYKDAFDCIVKLGDGFKKFAIPAQALVELRGIKADLKTFDDLKASAAIVSESASSFKTIREMFRSIKTDNSTDTVKKLAKYSKQFGEGVNALVSADVALSKTQELQSLIAQGRLIEATVEALDEIVYDKNFWKEWGDFGETVHQILTLTSKISEWENEIKVFNGTSLDELAAVFSKFPELNNVEIDFMDRLTALRLVIPMYTPNINELRDDFIKSLKPVLKLDLRFSRFKSAVAGMPETIKQVSKVLNGVNEDLVVFPPPVKPDKPVDTERILFTIITVMLVSCFFSTLLSLCIGNRCGMRTKFKNCLKRIFKKPTRSERNMMK